MEAKTLKAFKDLKLQIHNQNQGSPTRVKKAQATGALGSDYDP